MSGYPFALALCLLVIALLIYLLRARRIREKYAGVWIATAVAVAVLGAFPQLAAWLAALVGVETPANLVFAIALVVLLVVCIQLSTEVSNLEEETRTLAEEIALVRLDLSDLRDALGGEHVEQPAVGGPSATGQASTSDAATDQRSDQSPIGSTPAATTELGESTE